MRRDVVAVASGAVESVVVRVEELWDEWRSVQWRGRQLQFESRVEVALQ